MKYKLYHRTMKDKEKNFSSTTALEKFLSENNWTSRAICDLINDGEALNWTIEKTPTTNKEAFSLLWEEVEDRFKNSYSNYDGDLEFFVRHNLQVLAVYHWQNTGASKYEFCAKVTKKELKEYREEFEKISDSFECPKCNHVGFYDYDEEITHINFCYSCHYRGEIFSNRNVIFYRNKLKDLAG